MTTNLATSFFKGVNWEERWLDKIQLMTISCRLELVWFCLFWFGLVRSELVKIGLVRSKNTVFIGVTHINMTSNL